ncbi:hypothetical protein P9112_000944 [Eukaryota sp. TZLM1-RC]
MSLSTQLPNFITTHSSLPHDLTSRINVYLKLSSTLTDSKFHLNNLKCLAEISSFYSDSLSESMTLKSESFLFLQLVTTYFEDIPDISGHFVSLLSKASLDVVDSLVFRIGLFLFVHLSNFPDTPSSCHHLCIKVFNSLFSVTKHSLNNPTCPLLSLGVRSSSHLLVLYWCGEVSYKGWENGDESLKGLGVEFLTKYLKAAYCAQNGADCSRAEAMMMNFMEN